MLTLRSTKGSALTYAEADANFSGLADGSLITGGGLTGLSGSSGSSLIGFIQSGTGAVSTTIQNKARDWVSVKDYGAIGDDVTNDTAAITAADNSTFTAIYLPHGTYKTTLTTLSITKTYFGPGTIRLNGTLASPAGAWIKWNGATGGAATMPYLLSAYHAANGAFFCGVNLSISNKRVDVAGSIQGCNAVAGGTEPAMVDVSPDVDGPSLRIESHSTHGAGVANQTALAIYDLDAIVGGATAYSVGYGTKKFAVNGKGDIFWGSNLGLTPNSSYDIKLSVLPAGVVEFVGSTSAYLKLTAGPSGDTSLLLNGRASGNQEAIEFQKNGTMKWKLHQDTSATNPILYLLTNASAVSMKFKFNKSIILGDAELATGAAAGFIYLPRCNGTPTGTPEAENGVPFVYDYANNIIYIYNGAWKKTVALT